MLQPSLNTLKWYILMSEVSFEPKDPRLCATQQGPRFWCIPSFTNTHGNVLKVQEQPSIRPSNLSSLLPEPDAMSYGHWSEALCFVYNENMR